MKPIQRFISEFRVEGKIIRTNNLLELDPQTAQIGYLWESFLSKGDRSLRPYAVYSAYSSDENGDFDVTVGVKSELGTLVHQNKYLVFEEKGEAPECVLRAWRSVWEYFKTSEETRLFQTDFEEYSADGVQIYIGIL